MPQPEKQPPVIDDTMREVMVDSLREAADDMSKYDPRSEEWKMAEIRFKRIAEILYPIDKSGKV